MASPGEDPEDTDERGRLRPDQVPHGELQLTGRQMFDIRAFNLQPPQILTIRVHPQVEVDVDVVGRLSS